MGSRHSASPRLRARGARDPRGRYRRRRPASDSLRELLAAQRHASPSRRPCLLCRYHRAIPPAPGEPLARAKMGTPPHAAEQLGGDLRGRGRPLGEPARRAWRRKPDRLAHRDPHRPRWLYGDEPRPGEGRSTRHDDDAHVGLLPACDRSSGGVRWPTNRPDRRWSRRGLRSGGSRRTIPPRRGGHASAPCGGGGVAPPRPPALRPGKGPLRRADSRHSHGRRRERNQLPLRRHGPATAYPVLWWCLHPIRTHRRRDQASPAASRSRCAPARLSRRGCGAPLGGRSKSRPFPCPRADCASGNRETVCGLRAAAITGLAPALSDMGIARNGASRVADLLNLTDDNFEDIIEEHELVLVDFWSETCAPCRQMLPIVEELARECGDRAIIAKLNIHEAPIATHDVGIRGVPTFVLFRDGKPAGHHLGRATKAQLRALLQQPADND
ncbi:hypothetical protein GC173_08900 [bacterium]|nr:hypothetical protein [bacterium]